MANKDKYFQGNYASYIGFNRPINPGISVLIDFLDNFFENSTSHLSSEALMDMKKIKSLNNVVTKETDDNVKDKLYESFAEWIQIYFTYQSNDKKNKSKLLLPLTQNMIHNDTKARDYLRNILCHLLYNKSKDVTTDSIIVDMIADRDNIVQFLFNKEQNDMYKKIIDVIAGSLIENTTDTKSPPKAPQGTIKFVKNTKDLADKFRRDLDMLLTSPLFNKLDIYRKINFFSLLLNFYVTMYAINRAYESEPVYILAKGSPDFSTAYGKFYTAALGNFSNIRERIFKISESFYEGKINKHCNGSKNQLIVTVNSQMEMTILSNGKDIWVDLGKELFELNKWKLSQEKIKILKDYLDIGVDSKKVDIKHLASAFVHLSKKRTSSVRLVSSIFSGQGKEACMVFPTTRIPHKYYAMSSEITELLLKLFLAPKKQPYATLGMFLTWLEEEYGIYISHSDNLMTYLTKNSIKEPSNMEFFQNVEAFIKTLESISAIMKLSDNSYLVHDAGNIGGIPWSI